MFPREAWQADTDIAGHLVHTGRAVLTLGVLALRGRKGLKVWGKKVSFELQVCSVEINIKLWLLSGPFLIDVDLAVSALVASIAVTLVVTHQVQALTSIDAGIWRVDNIILKYKM